jgi:hypothetical protein
MMLGHSRRLGYDVGTRSSLMLLRRCKVWASSRRLPFFVAAQIQRHTSIDAPAQDAKNQVIEAEPFRSKSSIRDACGFIGTRHPELRKVGRRQVHPEPCFAGR